MRLVMVITVVRLPSPLISPAVSYRWSARRRRSQRGRKGMTGGVTLSVTQGFKKEFFLF